MNSEHHIQILSEEQAVSNLKNLPRPWAQKFLALYSNWLGGVVTDPWLMQIPMDDHMVHRGDGVFEAMKCVAGRIYRLDAHLDRLMRSAQSISLNPPLSPVGFKRLLVEVTRAGQDPDCMVRIFLSRGPGGFGVSPAESPAAGIYVVIAKGSPPAPAAYENGVRAGISDQPGKKDPHSAIKSCNYLPNVLLKRDALVRGWDFALGLDDEGHLTEGPTENFCLIDQQNRMLLPMSDHILLGTTMQRVYELAHTLMGEGSISAIMQCALTPNDLMQAKELMMVGTTLDVLPVTSLNGQPLNTGKVGEIAPKLLALLRHDILHNHNQSTAVF